MKYINIIQRFIPLQFGKIYGNGDLFSSFQDSLEKINHDGMMVLNDISFFQDFINDGVRSEKSKHQIIYVLVHIQLALFLLYSISGISNVILFLFIILSIMGQYILCWTMIHVDKQNQFVHQILEWSTKLSDDLDLMNYLVLETVDFPMKTTPFNEDKYAKLWLKEMSTGMDMPWESIAIELLPGESFFVPNIRVSIGGIRKSIQDASAYGFASGKDNLSPNILLRVLILFSRKKKIKFFGMDEEKNKIDTQVKQLGKHLELLFGKRDDPPILFNEETQEWKTVVNIVDRSNTDRNNIKQSLDIFIKIMNSYTGNIRLL